MGTMVKYLLDPPRGESMRLHAIGDYEFSYARVKHSSYNELKEGVLRCCPSAYRCIIPIVLHHELVWEMRKEEVDRLTQPIFQVDASLPSPKPDTDCVGQEEYPHIDWEKTASVCVAIVPSALRTRGSGPVSLSC
jgi:hypothetical protein